MIYLNCDYNEGAQPAIIKRMVETNLEQHIGYSEDAITEEAKSLIKAACKRDDIDVHILVGGTQTNMTVIPACLRPHQGVISSVLGHINRHETGTIEAHGHKILTLDSADGKISAEQVVKYCEDHYNDESHEHVVMPGMVYISNPTEMGAIYSRAELSALKEACLRFDLPLFLDGARLGYGMAAEGNDVDLPFLCEVCDVFYIGGTKQGALMGEAVVIVNDALKKDFRYIIKQNGGMLAKGRLLGIQFAELFKNDLYMEGSRHAIRLAMKIKEGFIEAGYKPYVDCPTNQQYFIVPNRVEEALARNFVFDHECRLDDEHWVIRFCTSWATKEENVDFLLAQLSSLK